MPYAGAGRGVGPRMRRSDCPGGGGAGRVAGRRLGGPDWPGGGPGRPDGPAGSSLVVRSSRPFPGSPRGIVSRLRGAGPAPIAAVSWDGAAVVLLDQTRLPDAEVELRCTDVPTLVDAIRRLACAARRCSASPARYGVALAAARGDDVRRPRDRWPAPGRPR